MSRAMVRVGKDGVVDGMRQTAIGAFLMSGHGALARQLAMAVGGPVRTPAAAELHAQFCRETEIVSLLARSVAWTLHPFLPMQAWRWELAWLPRPAEGVADPALARLVDLAALGHALHAAIRPAAILPETAKQDDPFNVALMRIEAESSRLIQAQILFLKGPMLAEARDRVSDAVAFRHEQVAGLWEGVVA